MASSVMPLPFLCLFLLLLSCNSSGGIFRLAHGQAPGQASWCMAKTSSSKEALTNNINYACEHIENCSIIQEGGACYYPNTKMNHASVAMNIYYQKNGKHFWNCNFTNSAVIVVTDPSYEGCKFQFESNA